MLFALYTDWLAHKALLAALGVKEEDMLGTGDVDAILPAEPEAPATDPEARRRQVETFIAGAGGDL